MLVQACLAMPCDCLQSLLQHAGRLYTVYPFHISLTYGKCTAFQQVIRTEGLIYMVLEYGDIDLARLLAKHEKTCKEGGSRELDENFIRLYWQQMLQVLATSSPMYIRPLKVKMKVAMSCCWY